MSKLRMATVWLDGCSGCHMSLLDLDERLLDLADKIELVYSPLVDMKEFPAEVDIALVEGPASSEEDVEKILRVRSRSKLLVALGDCAVTGNIPSMRNPFPLAEVLDRAYQENADRNRQIPAQVIPRLLPRVRPVHELVSVDLFLPGCPPPADLIHFVLSELVDGRVPDVSLRARFGA